MVTIWEGFKAWFGDRGLSVDYVLYSNYERQVEALVAGEVHVAWNSPLAWARTRRLAARTGGTAEALAMRDTDRDLTSVIVVRAGSPVREVADLTGCRVGVGAVDSPQATLIPLWHLARAGLRPDREIEVVRHDVGVGMHGDHIGGERDAAQALLLGEVEAACMIDANHLAFSREGTLPAGVTRILTQTPPFDHCNFSVVAGGEGAGGPTAPSVLLDRFRELLLSMSYDDPSVRPLLDLEGLKSWLPGRTSGYGPLEQAVAEQGFYSEDGAVTAPGYSP